MSMTGGRRVVRVRGAADALTKTLDAYLEDPSPDSLILIEAGELQARSSLRKLAENHVRAAALACYRDEGAGLTALVNEVLGADGLRATPDAMRVVGQLGQILGPRGLMPNPKVGTVTADVEGAVQNAKAGQVRYRTDKAGIIHCAIGRADFEVDALKENLNALLADLKKAKPASAKGSYVKKLTVSSTMGPGVSVDRASVDA